MQIAYLKSQRGFTLIELLAVMAIMGILAGVVAGAVTGLGTTSQETRLAGDENTLGKAADRFFTDAFPQTYPVLDPDNDNTGVDGAPDGELDNDDNPPLPAGDLGVRVLDFDASLPQDATLSFVPDFLKEVPDSSALVSWRVDQTTGNVFFTEDGASLVKPSLARLDVKAKDTSNEDTSVDPAIRVQSDYVIKLSMRKNEAPINTIKVIIPAGYIIGGQQLSENDVVGSLVIKFGADNPWDTGNTLTVATADVKVVSANEWKIDVTYDTNTGGSSGSAINVKNTSGAADDRTHTISIVPPSGSNSPGKLTLTLDRDTLDGVETDTDYDDPDVNEATETWTLTIFGEVTIGTTTTNLVTNPETTGVFRWLAEENTAIDIEKTFDGMAGNQAVVIK